MASYGCRNCSRQGFPLKDMVRLMVCNHMWCLDCVKFWVVRHYDARDSVFNASERPVCPACGGEFLEGVRHMTDIKIITQLLPLYADVAVGVDFYVACKTQTCPQYLVLNGDCGCVGRARFCFNKALQIFEVFQ